jgi:TDG/mug DNA glycosylase family protein
LAKQGQETTKLAGMPSRSEGFPPIAAPSARVLILGSLPGQVSLQRQQYYAQPQNVFWRIMGALFGAGPDVRYEERTRRLIEQRVAVWDVCRAAVRPGSLDTAIDLATVIPNDFGKFFAAHVDIRCIFLNGATAARLYGKLVVPQLRDPARALPTERLPSTSPAHASLRFEQKLERWRLIRGHLEP